VSCSKAYRDLVVTHGGLTIDNQTGFVPSHFDYDEWLALARRLGLRAFTHLERLKTTAPEAGELRQQYEGLEAQFQSLRARYEALPSIWTCCFMYEDTTRNIGDAASLCIETACLMEEIDKVISRAGASPPVEPPTHGSATKPKTVIAGAGTLALALGAAYLWFKSK